MAKKFYTFIVVPHASSELHKVRVPALTLYILASIGFILFFVAVGLGFTYAKMAFTVADYTQIEAENTQLKVEKRNLEVSTQKLTSKIGELEELSSRLVNLIENDIWTKRFGKLNMPGLGGSTIDYRTADLVGRSSVENLKDRTAELESDLKLLEQVAVRRDTIIRATPTIWPVAGRISSHYGNRMDPFTGDRELHMGVDIAGLYGSVVHAPADGIVVYAQRKAAYGNLVILDHGNGLTTRHGHLARFAVRPGQKVHKGDVIGHVGTTGRSTAPHLHYEVRLNDRPVNPRNYLPRGD
jgi:murein DD-endopeptidase MepM/ murein hydrolase activator NlpD